MMLYNRTYWIHRQKNSFMIKALEYHRGVQNYIIRADAIILGVVNSLVRTCRVINNSGSLTLPVDHSQDWFNWVVIHTLSFHDSLWKLLKHGKMCSSIWQREPYFLTFVSQRLPLPAYSAARASIAASLELSLLKPAKSVEKSMHCFFAMPFALTNKNTTLQ